MKTNKYILFFILLLVTINVFTKIGGYPDGFTAIIISVIFGTITTLLILFLIKNYNIIVKINHTLVLLLFLLGSLCVCLILVNVIKIELLALPIFYIYLLITAWFFIYYLFYFLGKIKNNILNKVIGIINKTINFLTFLFIFLFLFCVIGKLFIVFTNLFNK